jgi:hypothetical protein
MLRIAPMPFSLYHSRAWLHILQRMPSSFHVKFLQFRKCSACFAQGEFNALRDQLMTHSFHINLNDKHVL